MRPWAPTRGVSGKQVSGVDADRKAPTIVVANAAWSAPSMTSQKTREITTVVVDSPLGALRLSASENGITRIDFSDDLRPEVGPVAHPLLAALKAELASYFAGSLRRFTIPLAPVGTPFELGVWKALTDIPWGETRSYLDVALVVGSKNHTRAVGGANGRNPIAIVIPCHRVIAKNGTLGGYSGGLDKKRALLAREGRDDVTFAPKSAMTTGELPLVERHPVARDVVDRR
jgi:methylated-DNA-[protein]-cysteine S-methyltransferase